MSESAVAARRVGLIAAIKGDMALSDALKGEQVYVRRAPDGSPLPYVILGLTVETDRSYVMQPGQDGVEDMTIWHEDPVSAQELYVLFYRVLNNKKIALTDHIQVRGRLSYISDLPDPTREAYGVVARWRAQTVNA